jgi:hypothetical protein
MKKKILSVQEVDIRYYEQNIGDFVCLNDMVYKQMTSLVAKQIKLDQLG